ncbi:MAG: 4-hydroxy-tetrahydrodipicolinate reductase [Candidatus Omnitrophica bacterium]|nr:4-hydroxy-tetrahydrodipicolinate reductase [Candidatus Omnitrophota bacterium]
MVNIAISGISGRMGRRILSLSGQDKDLRVVFGLERPGHPDIGKEIERVKVSEKISSAPEFDCFIDFTSPQATIEHLLELVSLKKPVVIGTTGLDEKQLKIIRDSASNIPIVFAPNMSIGVNLLFRLLKEAANTLKGYRVQVEEAHHIHKKDAPSGTAKKIAEVINSQGFDIKFEDIKAIREAEIIGDHKVVFESDVDKIELSHSAKTRDIFVKGALVAAKWVIDKQPGLYSMEDVLFGEAI